MGDLWREDAALTQDLMLANEVLGRLMTYLPDGVMADEARSELHMAWHRLVSELRKVAKASDILLDDDEEGSP